MVGDLSDLVDMYIETLDEIVSEELGEDTTKFKAGHMSSDTTFEERLPKYLNKQNGFGGNEFSIYDEVKQEKQEEEYEDMHSGKDLEEEEEEEPYEDED